MKAKIEFDLDDPGDKLSHRRCVNATNAYLVFYTFDQYLRNYTKYGKDINPGDKIALPEGYHELTEKESVILHEVIHGIRKHFSEVMEYYKVDMDDLE